MKVLFLKILKITGIMILIGATLIAIFYAVSWIGFRSERQDINWGVTFSTIMARQLGLDVRETYNAMLSQLGVKTIRLPVYWQDIEPEKGEFKFDDYDYFLARAEESDAKVVLVIGRKLPRWPECHMPFWAHYLSERDQTETILSMVRTVVERYRNSPAVASWQIENEPFHIYGSDCAKNKISAAQVEKEIALARSLDSRPIMLTDSGEQGWWSSSLKRADTLGISMYFQVWNDTLKEVHFSFGPGFYILKTNFFGWLYPQKKIIVSEMEMEPWGPGLLPSYNISQQLKLMNSDEFRRRVAYARRTGFDTFYLWGVEWWYWLRTVKGSPDLWNQAGLLFKGQEK